MQHGNSIGLNIAGIKILLHYPPSKKNFNLDGELIPYSIKSHCLEDPKVNIRVYYGVSPCLPQNKKIIAKASDWLRIYSCPVKKFIYTINTFKEETVVKGVFKRNFEYKNLRFELQASLSIDRNNLGIAKSSLPLPYRTVIFNRNFKECHIYVREKKNSPLPFLPLEPPLLEIILINLLITSKKGIILHSSGVVDNDRAYLFVGDPGRGKSTMTRLWKLQGNVMLQDEKIIVREKKGQFFAYSMPGYATGLEPAWKGIKLKRIFFIYHSKRNRVKKLDPSEAANYLLKHGSGAFFYLGTNSLDWCIQFCKNLSIKVPCYSLGFIPSRKTVDFIQRID